jgi:predicted HicB family RNase H-like nuclease
MELMTYKGYTARIEIDPDAKVLAGRVLDLRDVIVFEGETVADIEQQFHASVDDYLAWCAEDGREPDKPYSGRLPFRTKPETHRKIALAAAKAGKSINAWMEQTLADRATAVLEEDERTSA